MAKKMHPLFDTFLRLTVVTGTFLGAAVAVADSFQEIVELECPGGTFVAEGRAFNENEAGTSSVERRYVFRGKTLPALNYERYYKNLDVFLSKDGPNTRLFGLRLSTDGLSHYGGSYESGDSIYLSPAEFSRPDFEMLGECQKETGFISCAPLLAKAHLSEPLPCVQDLSLKEMRV